MGVRADDPVAYIEPSVAEAFRARLARARIVAKMFARPTSQFWADEGARQAVVRALSAAAPA